MDSSTAEIPSPEALLLQVVNDGSGKSVDDPIVLPRRKPNDYVSEEYRLVEKLLEKRNAHGQMRVQALLSRDGRSIDRITMEVLEATHAGAQLSTEHFFFDRTDCTG